MVRIHAKLGVAALFAVTLAWPAWAQFTTFAAPITGATDFITGFPSCLGPTPAGPTGVVFDGDHFFATDICNAVTYRFSASGGTVAAPDAFLSNGLVLGLAINRGAYYGNSFSAVYRLDPVTLQKTFVASIAQNANGVVGDPLTTDIYVAAHGIYRIEGPTSSAPVVTMFAPDVGDGIAFTSDGTRLYVAAENNMLLGFDRAGTKVLSLDVGHPADGIAVARDGAVIGGIDVSNNVFINCNDGVLLRVDVNNGNAISVVASGGSRGDLVTVGPDDCLYATQTDRIVKLSPCFFQSPSCGNGTLQTGEECDDGNVASGDGCDGSCHVECRCTCSGEPSACTCPNSFARVGVAAKKLIVVDKRELSGRAKVVFVAKDPGVEKGNGTDVTAISARLDVAYASWSASGAFVVPLGSTNGTDGWKINKTTIAKYLNKGAPSGPTQVKVALVKPGRLLKLVAKGVGDTPIDIVAAGAPPPQASGEVLTGFCVTNDGDEACHCSVFSDCSYKLIAAGTGAKLVCRRGSPEADCTAVCGP